MSKRKDNHHGEAAAAPVAKRSPGLAVAGLLVVAIVAVLGLWWSKAKHANEPSATPPPIKAEGTTPPAPAAASKADFQKLKGKWQRPDGGYVVEVKSVDDNGRMDASYHNPQPINVSKAEASQDGATIKVFIELRDVNYPGSTYDLTYDPQTDQLKGIYFQAALQQRYEVVFVRMK